MWHYEQSALQADRIIHYRLFQDETLLTFQDFLDHLSHDKAFRQFYNQLLADCPWEAYFWEHPPVSGTTRSQDYECMLVNSHALARVVVEANAFAEYFEKGEAVVHFPNLGGDAHLIVPTPMSDVGHYVHLARFVRHAPEAQQQAFWQCVGRQMTAAILPQQKRWLSTSGLGVYWLHARIDQRPKYYQYRPYADWPG